jgi:hypothetical protein
LKSADASAVFAELIRAGLQALIEAEAAGVPNQQHAAIGVEVVDVEGDGLARPASQ